MQVIKMENTIKVNAKDKSTTIRLSQRTKKMLDALAAGKETHEEILLRLIKLANSMSEEQGSKIVDKKNMIGTKYERASKTISIETSKAAYSIVCTYNDLNIFAAFRNNKQLASYISDKGMPLEWEADLEIVNAKKNKGKWEKPPILSNKECLLLYLVALKQILEETFGINIYEIATDEDYFDSEKWEKAYKRNKLSMESFYSDVQKKLQGSQ